MWTLGKWAILTYDELEQRNNDARALGYRAGLRSKWKAKRKGNETEQLLAAVAPGVVIPSRNAETYEKPQPVVSFVDDGTPFGFNVKESEMDDAA